MLPFLVLNLCSASPSPLGTISFGLVSIPVKLYSATDASAGVSFNLLHKDGSRLKQQYICPKDGEIVPRDQMVKGYEFAKDHYVTFTTEELKALEEKSTQTIEIVEFVPVDQVDPVYFDKAYYLGPDKGGEKAYAALEAHARDRARGARPVRGARQAVPRDAAAGGQRARDAAAALRRRGAPLLGGPDRRRPR